jgi:hypothetical protein
MEVITAAFKPIVDLIDELHTSDEEKAEMKHKMFTAQSALFMQAMEFEKAALEAQARIVEAEAKSEHWLTANWRPIVMLGFFGLVVARWFGYSAPNIPQEVEMQLWTLLQVGIGGYVAGRSLEKVAEAVAPVLKRSREG